MNKIVLEHYPASKLPNELREGIAHDASVKVTIEEEGELGGREEPLTSIMLAQEWSRSQQKLRQQLQKIRQNTDNEVTVEEAVARIRELRDEWDD